MKRILSIFTILLIAVLLTLPANANLGSPMTPIVEEDALAIYPIIGDDLAAADLLTLDEGLNAGLVTIRDIGEVRAVLVTNKSAKPLLILGGELIRGGKQDRVYDADLIIAPKSQQEVAVYCVEPGRWSGDYNFGKVSSSGEGKQSEGAIAPPLVRERATINQDQQGVWSAVAYQNGGSDGWRSIPANGAEGQVLRADGTWQDADSINSIQIYNGSSWVPVTVTSGPVSGSTITTSGSTGTTITMAGTAGSVSTSTSMSLASSDITSGTISSWQLASSGDSVTVTSGSSSTTLLQVYADPKLQEEFNSFASRVSWTPDTVGMVITLNGQIIMAERFASSALFAKYRGKLLRAAFLESKRRDSEKVSKVSITAEDIANALRRADARILVEREGSLYARTITRGEPYATQEIASGARSRAQPIHFVSFNTTD